MVLFDEFAAWAMKRGLDLEDDDDATFEDFGDRGSSNLSQNQLQKRSCITNREEPESGPSVKKPNSENVLRPSKEEWSALTAKLCFQKTPQQATARQKLFQRIDVNGNGYLSLAELEKGIRDELRLPKIFDSKQAVLRAFQVHFYSWCQLKKSLIKYFCPSFTLSLNFTTWLMSFFRICRSQKIPLLLLQAWPMTLLSLRSFESF